MKNIVERTLESRGELAKLRAQLRAAVFTVLDDKEKAAGKNKASGPASDQMLATIEGQLAVDLIHDMLDFYNLPYTKNVLINESGLVRAHSALEIVALNVHRLPSINPPFLLHIHI